MHGLRRTNGHSTLLHDNLVRLRDFGNFTCAELAVLDIGSAARPDTLGFGGSVHRNEDNVRHFYFVVNVEGEEEILDQTFVDHLA